MKKLILGILTLSLFGITFAYGPRQICSNYPDFSIEGPDHHDFLLIVEERPYLHDSLYKISANEYFGPETLATMQMQYNMCHAM